MSDGLDLVLATVLGAAGIALPCLLAGNVDMVVLDDSYHVVTVDRQRHVVAERTVA